jgi:PhzF family phenazine biosynthesis protein
MDQFGFRQVDVFTSQPLRGTPLAVVLGADALSEAQMVAFANWTNLSETTFLLRPTNPIADYRVRIFTPQEELPFAGHPTLGSCHVWLATGATPKGREVVQECGIGLVRIRRRCKTRPIAMNPSSRMKKSDIRLSAPPTYGICVRTTSNSPIMSFLASATSINPNLSRSMSSMRSNR